MTRVASTSISALLLFVVFVGAADEEKKEDVGVRVKECTSTRQDSSFHIQLRFSANGQEGHPFLPKPFSFSFAKQTRTRSQKQERKGTITDKRSRQVH